MKLEDQHEFTFADLFAGIGGMRHAFEDVGGTCVLTSEIDPHALITYKAQNWKQGDHTFVNDVNDLAEMTPGDQVPQFDVLLAGFPCQPYSIAGLRQGLDDEKGRGQVFLSILKILEKNKPKAFLLENVKGMLSHDNGRTITFMIQQLRDCGYDLVEPMVLNSMTHGGVPQNRERVFLIGFHQDLAVDVTQFPNIEPLDRSEVPKFKDFLEEQNVEDKYFYTEEKYKSCYGKLAEAMTRDDTAYQWRRVYVRENKSGVCPALTANMGSGGHNVPLVKVKNGIRKLTPRECAKLQGFDLNEFVFPENMSDSHLYHQFGNSVTVPLIKRIAQTMRPHFLQIVEVEKAS